MGSTTTGQSKDDRDYAWHRHPALIAGISAVTALLGSILTIVAGRSGALPESISPVPPTATVTSTVFSTTTVTTTVTPTADSTTAPSSPPAPDGEGTLVWKESIKVPADYGVEIDEPRPVVNSDTLSVDLRSFTSSDGVPYAWLAYSAAAGSLDPGTPAGYENCVAALGTDAEPESFAVAKGARFCIKSGNSRNPHVGLFHVLAWNRTTGSAQVEVTVWSTS
jgi:hypothetical protein